MSRPYDDFSILKDHLYLSPKDWLAGVELIAFIMGWATCQVIYKKDRLEITEEDLLGAGTLRTSIQEEVETILVREEIIGSSLGNAPVNIAYNDSIHGWIF